MAEVTGLRNNATPFPVYGLPWGIVIPLLDADGDLVTGATTPDSEVSKNADTFADCTNEMTEIATNSGMYYLLLTGAEMTADVVTVICKSATAGMKTTPIVLYPRKLVAIRTGTCADDGSGTSTIVLDAGASAVDDFYNGMIIAGVLDSNTEVRMITDYTGSTQTASVTPDFVTAPDNNDTFTIYRVEGAQIQQANVSHWNSLATVELPLAPTTAGRKLDVSAGGEAGIDWANIGSPTTAVNLSATNIDVDQVVASVSGAVGSVTGAVGSVTGNVGGNVTGTIGGLTAAALKDFFDTDTTTDYASAVAGSVVKEIADNAGGASLSVQDIVDGVWDEDATGHQTQGSFGQAIGDPGADTDTIWALANTNLNATVGSRASQASVDTVDDLLDTEVAAIKTVVDAIKLSTDNLPSDPADASVVAGLIAGVDAKVDTVDTVVDAIKGKTDSLTFTVANQVDANIQYVNDVEVNGDGQPGTEWGP